MSNDAKKHDIFKTCNMKILKITAKLSVMRGSPSETFENIFALYISVQAATAVNVSVCFPVKQGERHGRSALSPTHVQVSGL